MNSMELWQQRLGSYQKKVMKYARYMLNDHFMIVLFFLFGFFLMQYTNWIRTIRILEWPLLWLLSAILAFLPLIGQLATLMEPADVHFLSVIQQNLKLYMTRAVIYSWLLPVIVMGVGVGIVVPIFMQAYGSGLHYFTSLFLNLLAAKYLHFLLQRWHFEGRVTEKWWHSIAIYLLSLGTLFCTMLGITNSWIIVVSIAELLSLFALRFWIQRTRIFYQWQLLVDTEQKRQQRLFRFIALFVDVPFVRKSPAKRRAYLDGVVRVLSPRALHPYRYLLARTVIRSANYLSLLLQVMVLSLIVALLSDTWYWTLVINSLILLLMNFQLMSLFKNVNGQGMYIEKLFSREEILDDFTGIILQLMAGIVLVIIIVSVVVTGNYYLFAGLILYPLIVFLFVQGYLKPRIIKVKKQVRK